MIDLSDFILSFTVYGNVRSKSNSRRLVTVRNKKTGKNHPAFIKSQAALDFVNDFYKQCPKLETPLDGDLFIQTDIYYDSEKPDLDPSLVFDCLQAAKIIVNDRRLRSHRVRHGIDKTSPRVEISIRPCEPGDRAGE